MSAQPPAPAFRLNFGEAFTFLFRDPRWLPKCGLAALCTLFGFTFIPSLLVAGYLLTLSERVARLETPALPPWTDFGALLRKGWRVFLVRLVYYLPIWLIVLVMLGLVLAAFLSLGGLGLFTGASAAAPGSLAPLWLLAPIIPLALLLVPLSLALPCLTPAADAQLVLHEGQLEPAFRFGGVFAFIRRNLGQYALMVVIYVGASQVLSGGTSASIQIGQFGGSGGNTVNTIYLAIFGAIVLVATVVGTVAGLYLRCTLAHMLGQLCWHEREVRDHGR